MKIWRTRTIFLLYNLWCIISIITVLVFLKGIVTGFKGFLESGESYSCYSSYSSLRSFLFPYSCSLSITALRFYLHCHCQPVPPSILIHYLKILRLTPNKEPFLGCLLANVWQFLQGILCYLQTFSIINLLCICGPPNSISLGHNVTWLEVSH